MCYVYSTYVYVHTIYRTKVGSESRWCIMYASINVFHDVYTHTYNVLGKRGQTDLVTDTAFEFTALNAEDPRHRNGPDPYSGKANQL